MDSSAIEIIQSTAIQAAALEHIENANLDSRVFLKHKNWELENLERFKSERDRFRGVFSTETLIDFSEYVKFGVKKSPVSVFISQRSLVATAILNLGDIDNPGHCDHRALYSPNMGAAWKAMVGAHDCKTSQRSAAEWFEDWAPFIEVYDADNTTIPLPSAINAMRKMTIEQSKKVEHAQGSFRAARSSMDIIEASAEVMPAFFDFTCIPHQDMDTRTVRHRISVLTSGDAPIFVMRPVQFEAVLESVQREFHESVASSLDRILSIENKVSVFTGAFTA